MRYAKRVDSNHSFIRDGIRAAGHEVLDMSALGTILDLCVRIGPGRSIFIEVKNPKIKKAEQAMTEAQEKWWYFNWRVSYIVQTLEEALEAIRDAKQRG